MKKLITLLVLLVAVSFGCDDDSSNSGSSFTSGDLTINISDTSSFTSGELVPTLHSAADMTQSNIIAYKAPFPALDGSSSITIEFTGITTNPIYINVLMNTNTTDETIPTPHIDEWVYTYGVAAQGGTALPYTLQNGTNTLNITYPDDFYKITTAVE